ncbi:acyltransferase family protein [Streptosporangium lutulentum]
MTTSRPRLAWLDALRGLAAVAVLLEHMLPWLLPALPRQYLFSLGMYGVLVFFLVSGYIIPVSLEARGDVRAFWISGCSASTRSICWSRSSSW